MTLAYNRITYELDGIIAVPDDVEGLSMLMHFDYPEAWHLNGNAQFSDGAKFGTGCVYFPDAESSVSIANTTGMYNLNPLGNYELEAFVKFKGEDRTAEYTTQGYYFYGGHTFKFYSTAVTWAKAKAICEELGGHLATSISEDKNKFLRTLSSTYMWLGATDEETEGTWKWITGETWNYTNWYSSQPDNANSNQHYLRFTNSSNVWYDDAATAAYGFICEWDYDFRERNFAGAKGINGCIPYNGHTFKYFNTVITWAEAKAACEALGGHLATSTSAEKNAFIRSFSNTAIWLGATDEVTEGIWVWETGETWDYTNWYSGQPDNASSTQHYLRLADSSSDTWYDYSATDTGRYVCEWDFDMIGDISGWVDRNIFSVGGLALAEKTKVEVTPTTTTLTSSELNEKLLAVASKYSTYYSNQGYKFYGGHTYKLIKTLTTQNNARTACAKQGGHLAIISNRAEFDYLCAWVGNTRTWVEGSGKAVNSSDLSHINLNNGEYADYSAYPWSGDGGYTALFIYNSGYFADENPKTMPYQYICEWDYDMRTQGFSYFGGHTFKVFDKLKTWSEAKTLCGTMGGHLATITSQEKRDFLSTLPNVNETWTGGIYNPSTGTVSWITGEESNFIAWASGQPDGNGNYIQLYNKNNTAPYNFDEIAATYSRKYICEWDYDMRYTTTIIDKVFDCLSISSSAWGVDAITTASLDNNTWYHLLLRISGETAKLFINGTQALSETISGNTITPETVTLGGYVGWMDEFAFRRNAGVDAPAIPERAYGAEIVTETVSGGARNAPVSRVAWSCENLPEGLTLSESGLLSGRPTTAGMYECEFSVATNWGTDTKTVKITVE